MSRIVSLIASVFLKHKLKWFAFIGSAVIFLVLIFPYDDLSEIVTPLVADATRNTVYLTFDHMGLNFFPTPAIAMSNVSVDTPTLPTINVKELEIAPSLLGLLTFKPGFTASASGFLSGDVDVSLKGLGKGAGGAQKQMIDVDARRVDLKRLKEVISLPLQMHGVAEVQASVQLDPTFTEQPDGTVQMKLKNFEILPSLIPTPFGPVSLPGFKWSNVSLKGKIGEAKFVIDDGLLGSAQDPLNGKVRGQIDVRVLRQGAGAQPDLGAYDFRVELNTTADTARELALFLGFLDSFKTTAPTGSRYLFRAVGPRLGVTPKFSSLASFN